MILDQGAEAIIIKEENVIIKDRIEKAYRNKIIDLNLRTSRTKREAKVLEKLKELDFSAPRLIRKEKTKLFMNFVEGHKLKDVFELDYKNYAKEIGEKIAFLHNNSIIHGDLTTSNMILNINKLDEKDEEIYFIDFGLSFFSTKEEDKAVDLHLLDRALESKHYKIYPEAIEIALKSYSDFINNKEILTRYEKVKKRGRNKK